MTTADEPTTVLLVGAGRMSPPVIDYFLNRTNYVLILADVDLAQAEQRAQGYPAGRIRCIAVTVREPSNDIFLDALKKADVAIGLVPPAYDTGLAERCIQTGTHLVTASYVTDSMWQLAEQAKSAGVLILGETGLDPGLDHMEAMRMIQEIRAKGGRIDSLISSCGGIPYNMVHGNPLDYKISWSPDVLLSVLRGRAARFKRQGQLVTIAPEMVFQFQPDEVVRLDGYMRPEFDTYPNGNAEHYIALYGIDEVRTIIRKTLRYRGWNSILRDLHRLGWFSDRPAVEAIAASNTAQLDDATLKTLDWLGLSEDTDTTLTAFDYFAEKFVGKPELTYSAGERDLVILRNQVKAFDPDRGEHKLRITSTLTVVGDDDGYSAMQKTVGYTCAIATRLIADGEYQATGVQIPVAPELYQPVLDELAGFGNAFDCTTEVL